jgi:hypothetical protein
MLLLHASRKCVCARYYYADFVTRRRTARGMFIDSEMQSIDAMLNEVQTTNVHKSPRFIVRRLHALLLLLLLANYGLCTEAASK